MCLGVPGKIIEIYETDGLRMGRMDFGGSLSSEACLAYVPEAASATTPSSTSALPSAA